jgi:GNAT superfamily N-acetyltransferase
VTRPKLPGYLYIWYIGVYPDYQGQGPAVELRNEIFALADKRKLPILIETTGEKHRKVYQHCGFELYHTWTIGQNIISYYFLLRQPKSLSQ